MRLRTRPRSTTGAGAVCSLRMPAGPRSWRWWGCAAAHFSVRPCQQVQSEALSGARAEDEFAVAEAAHAAERHEVPSRTGGRAVDANLQPAQQKLTICIGNLNHLFFCPELYRRTREPSSARAFSENPGVALDGSGDAAVGSARLARRRGARSNSERPAPSAWVGNRFGLLSRLE